MVASSKGFPMICRPMGSPDLVKPQLRLIPGIPARFAEMVNRSDRYICRGSSVFSPNLKAGVGDVGVTITSQRLNASVKSWRISVRTLSAGYYDAYYLKALRAYVPSMMRRLTSGPKPSRRVFMYMSMRWSDLGVR